MLEHGGARIGTVEHVMAALAGCGIDNVLVERRRAGTADTGWLRRASSSSCWIAPGLSRRTRRGQTIEVRRPIRVSDGDAFAELRPRRPATGLDMALSIDFAAAAIGRQALSLRLTPDSFRHELARRPHVHAG